MNDQSNVILLSERRRLEPKSRSGKVVDLETYRKAKLRPRRPRSPECTVVDYFTDLRARQREQETPK